MRKELSIEKIIKEMREIKLVLQNGDILNRQTRSKTILAPEIVIDCGKLNEVKNPTNKITNLNENFQETKIKKSTKDEFLYSNKEMEPFTEQ